MTDTTAPYTGNPAHFWPSAAGLALLGFLWFGPLPEMARGSFSAHMVMHMGVVAVVSPLIAFGISRAIPAQVAALPPALAIAASLFEFAAVWTWHAPALHDAARMRTGFFVMEQASFLAAGVLVWTTAVGAKAAGVCALLITSMHMVLLGALLLLAPRALYACAEVCSSAASLTPLGDQQLGGALMLVIGGSAYLAGGLALLSSVLRDRAPIGEAG
jgi:putative membrane protein